MDCGGAILGVGVDAEFGAGAGVETAPEPGGGGPFAGGEAIVSLFLSYAYLKAAKSVQGVISNVCSTRSWLGGEVSVYGARRIVCPLSHFVYYIALRSWLLNLSGSLLAGVAQLPSKVPKSPKLLVLACGWGRP